MLVLRSDWQAALPTLTQLGNGLALITCLDCMLGNHADTAFMQLAPMLGITLGIGNHMQCLVSHSLFLQQSLPVISCFATYCVTKGAFPACTAFVCHSKTWLATCGTYDIPVCYARLLLAGSVA